ncbi:MAG: ATP synthase F1 subunit gamma [Acidobacteria bacterium]|nr:MAG: ATP synthase F1 subunit gamma [Acidobacteriota bacterium]
MANVLDIRRRVRSVKNTQQITKAMKMVSASRLRRASEKAVASRPYTEKLFEMHHSILDKLEQPKGEFYQVKEGKVLLVVVAGDKGLCGSFNSNIFKRAEQIIQSVGPDDIEIMPVGKKAVAEYKKPGYTTVEGFSGIFRGLDRHVAVEVQEKVLEHYRTDRYREVVILYNQFKNVLIQELREKKILPLVADKAEIVKGDEENQVEHLAEPGLQEILNELAPRVVFINLFQALLDSTASEHAARMTAMDAATNSAVEMEERLTLEMNKARQAAITTELIEIVSGAAAL